MTVCQFLDYLHTINSTSVEMEEKLERCHPNFNLPYTPRHALWAYYMELDRQNRNIKFTTATVVATIAFRNGQVFQNHRITFYNARAPHHTIVALPDGTAYGNKCGAIAFIILLQNKGHVVLASDILEWAEAKDENMMEWQQLEKAMARFNTNYRTNYNIVFASTDEGYFKIIRGDFDENSLIIRHTGPGGGGHYEAGLLSAPVVDPRIVEVARIRRLAEEQKLQEDIANIRKMEERLREERRREEQRREDQRREKQKREERWREEMQREQEEQERLWKQKEVRRAEERRHEEQRLEDQRQENQRREELLKLDRLNFDAAIARSIADLERRMAQQVLEDREFAVKLLAQQNR